MRTQTLMILTFFVVLSQCFQISASDQILTAYNRAFSQKMAAYSSITHCPKQCIISWTCGTTAKYPKLVNVTYLQNTFSKATGFVGYEAQSGSIIISWRGSSNAQNWIEDFNFQKEPYSACTDCKVHVGFMFDYKSNEKVLLAQAQAIMKFYKVSKIICTGQSLGGALSVINGIQFMRKFPQIPIQVHNFGCPRVGNQKLAAYIRTKIPNLFRVVHNRDLVPHLPPEATQYRHPPYEVLYTEDMSSYKVCDSSGEDKTCSNQFAPNYSTNDHDFYFMPISSPKCK